MSVTDSDLVKAAREYQAAYNAYIDDPMFCEDVEHVLALNSARKRYEMVRPRTLAQETEIIAALADEIERATQTKARGEIPDRTPAEAVRDFNARQPWTGPTACAHSAPRSLRQTCACCGVQDHLDFRVTDSVWRRVVPEYLQTAPVCLKCFDSYASDAGVSYAKDLSRLDFVGYRGSFSFVPVSALDKDEWYKPSEQA